MFLFVLFMAFIAGTLVVIGKNKLLETKAFDVGDYQYYIDKFPSEDNLGSYPIQKIFSKKLK